MPSPKRRGDVFVFQKTSGDTTELLKKPETSTSGSKCRHRELWQEGRGRRREREKRREEGREERKKLDLRPKSRASLGWNACRASDNIGFRSWRNICAQYFRTRKPLWVLRG